MIRSFRGKLAPALLDGLPMKGFPPDLRRVAQRKLLQLNAATRLSDIAVPPGNRLEPLQGEAKRRAFDPDQRSMASLLPVDQ